MKRRAPLPSCTGAYRCARRPDLMVRHAIEHEPTYVSPADWRATKQSAPRLKHLLRHAVGRHRNWRGTQGNGEHGGPGHAHPEPPRGERLHAPQARPIREVRTRHARPASGMRKPGSARPRPRRGRSQTRPSPTGASAGLDCAPHRPPPMHASRRHEGIGRPRRPATRPLRSTNQFPHSPLARATK